VGGGTITSAIDLVNEPNDMSTLAWFGIAQDAITAIRNTGFRDDIYVPGNGWTAAGSWNPTARSRSRCLRCR
jgi:hypothetical protein